MESPWRRAQIVFVYDAKRVEDPPRSMPAMLDWAKRNPGRLTHPTCAIFSGSTFLKQALYELRPTRRAAEARDGRELRDGDRAALGVVRPARPPLWRQGEQFPENGPAQRQLLNDGEIDMMSRSTRPRPRSRSMRDCCPIRCAPSCFKHGTIGNTSFVAIPYNAANKEGAMVVADFLLDPATQAHAQDIRQMGNFSVLDFAKLTPAERKRFDDLPKSPRCRPTPTRRRRCSSRIRRG